MTKDDNLFEALELGNLWTIPVNVSALAGAGALLIGFKTGDKAMIADIPAIDVISSSPTYSAKLEVFEQTSYSAGSVVASQNRNLNIRGSAPVTIIADAKTGVTATPLAANRVGLITASVNNKRSSLSTDNPPLILQPQTNYVIQITNTDTAAVDVNFRAFLWSQT